MDVAGNLATVDQTLVIDTVATAKPVIGFATGEDMYSNTLYSCKFGDSYSEPFLTTLGVKQVDSFRPTLFNIFVDDIKSSFIDNTKTKPVSLGVHTFNHLLYTDDLVILSESPCSIIKFSVTDYN
jgi:hypothetical protein